MTIILLIEFLMISYKLKNTLQNKYSNETYFVESLDIPLTKECSDLVLTTQVLTMTKVRNSNVVLSLRHPTLIRHVSINSLLLTSNLLNHSRVRETFI